VTGSEQPTVPRDQPTDRQTSLLTAWLTGWITQHLVYWLALNNQQIVRPTNWSGYQLTDCLADWLNDWLTQHLVYWLVDCVTDGWHSFSHFVPVFVDT
jgi:hypothetical protein